MDTKTAGELTFSFWNGKPGLAFNDICLTTEMHLEGQEKGKKRREGGEKKTWAEEFNWRQRFLFEPISRLISRQSG